MSNYTVSLKKIIDNFKLETLNSTEDLDKILISNTEINRPGLQFAGYYKYFDRDRIQMLGVSEVSYLQALSPDEYEYSIDTFMNSKPCCVIIARGMDVSGPIIDSAKKYGVPLFRSNESTSSFMASLNAFLNVELAPRLTTHGVLVEVYGEGILLIGESGVGKSETAIELIKRGHRLIADDAVEIRKVSNITLVGSAPENIRHFVELRGIGIINARRIFGMGAIKLTEKIDLIINLESWEEGKVYNRMGIDDEFTEFLGIQVPSSTIPIKPGRNLAIIIEVAAMNNRQKKMGYNAAQELLHQLGMDSGEVDENLKAEWDAFK